MTVRELIEKLTPYIDNIQEVQFELGPDDVTQDMGVITIYSKNMPEFEAEDDDDDYDDSGDED